MFLSLSTYAHAHTYICTLYKENINARKIDVGVVCSRNSPPFTETENLLPFSRGLVTGPYPELQVPVWNFITSCFFTVRSCETSPNLQIGGQPFIGCSRLVIQNVCSCPPYLRAVSSIRNWRTCHVVVTGIRITWLIQANILCLCSIYSVTDRSQNEMLRHNSNWLCHLIHSRKTGIAAFSYRMYTRQISCTYISECGSTQDDFRQIIADF
jgi:hypothetical protein